MTVLYPNQCYNKAYYKGTAMYLYVTLFQISVYLSQPLYVTQQHYSKPEL